MIEVRDLEKLYGRHRALDGISFRARAGEILGLLGPNGAGKSTTLRILAGYLAPSAGDAEIAGISVARDSLEARRRLGYLGEACAVPHELRVVEYLRYRGSLRGLRGAHLEDRIRASVAACQLEEATARIVGQLSKGFRQRVALAAALLADPPVLILDEPTSGLDPVQVLEFRSLVRALSRERTVLFSTHVLQEAEALCDRVVVLDRGRILAEGRPGLLGDGLQELEIEVLGRREQALEALFGLGELDIVEADVQQVRITLRLADAAATETRARVSRALSLAGCTVIAMGVAGGGLAAVFGRISRREAAS